MILKPGFILEFSISVFLSIKHLNPKYKFISRLVMLIKVNQVLEISTLIHFKEGSDLICSVF